MSTSILSYPNRKNLPITSSLLPTGRIDLANKTTLEKTISIAKESFKLIMCLFVLPVIITFLLDSARNLLDYGFKAKEITIEEPIIIISKESTSVEEKPAASTEEKISEQLKTTEEPIALEEAAIPTSEPVIEKPLIEETTTSPIIEEKIEPTSDFLKSFITPIVIGAISGLMIGSAISLNNFYSSRDCSFIGDPLHHASTMDFIKNIFHNNAPNFTNIATIARIHLVNCAMLGAMAGTITTLAKQLYNQNC